MDIRWNVLQWVPVQRLVRILREAGVWGPWFLGTERIWLENGGGGVWRGRGGGERSDLGTFKWGNVRGRRLGWLKHGVNRG